MCLLTSKAQFGSFFILHFSMFKIHKRPARTEVNLAILSDHNMLCGLKSPLKLNVGKQHRVQILHNSCAQRTTLFTVLVLRSAEGILKML